MSCVPIHILRELGVSRRKEGREIMGVADYISSLSKGYWTKPWKRVHSCETNGFIEFRELPEYILWMLPCCVSVIEPHRPDCQALLAIQSWNK